MLPRVDDALGELTPMVRDLAPYGCDIINFGTVFRSVTGFGGTGEGPNGPAMSFRLTVIPSPTENAGVRDGSGLVKRDGYPAPCKYRAEYAQLDAPLRGRR